MITIIKSTSTKGQILEAIKKVKRRKGLNTAKYCGVIKLKSSPLAIQKNLRDEWE